MFVSRNVIMNSFQWRKWFLFLIFTVYRRLDTVDGLKCYCNSERCPNSTCETDGYCFASTSLENKVQKFTYHCIELKSLIPIEHPFSCSTTKTKNESVVIKCCKSHDMCNGGLRLDLPQKPPGRSDVEVVPSMCPANYCTSFPLLTRDARQPHAKRPAPMLQRAPTALVYGARLHG